MSAELQDRLGQQKAHKVSEESVRQLKVRETLRGHQGQKLRQVCPSYQGLPRAVMQVTFYDRREVDQEGLRVAAGVQLGHYR